MLAFSSSYVAMYVCTLKLFYLYFFGMDGSVTFKVSALTYDTFRLFVDSRKEKKEKKFHRHI